MKYIIEKNNTKSSAYAYVTEELKTLKENITFIKSDIVIEDEVSMGVKTVKDFEDVVINEMNKK